MQYSDMFKNAMIQKLSGPDAISASALSKQVDVSQSTLSKWLRMAGVGPSYGFPNNAHEYTKMTKIKSPKRPNDWSAEDKLKFVRKLPLLMTSSLAHFSAKKDFIRHILTNGVRRCSMACKMDSRKIRPNKRTTLPNAFEPWKRRSIEKTKPWQRQQHCWCSVCFMI
jgi:hypothetical protein